MIVKILSSAGNFEGIDYSERKNDLGKSQLLKPGNFGALGHNVGKVNKSDYILEEECGKMQVQEEVYYDLKRSIFYFHLDTN